MVSCQQRGNRINISNVHSGAFLEKMSSKRTIRVLQDHLPLRVQMPCHSIYHTMASPHSWINEMPVLWEEDGMPVWIDSDTGTFVLCCVLCACWIGGRIGVDGSWIGGRKAIDCRPLGQSLKAAKCHKFTVTFITRGNRDYGGREISRVLANKNLDLWEVVVPKDKSIKCSDFGNSQIATWSSYPFLAC